MAIPSEAESLVADAPVSAHLATSLDDRPHVAPVWYGYREGTVYFQTGGKKLANLRANPRVALSIEDARGADVAWNVTLLGRASVVEDPDRVARVEGWLYDKYEDDEAESPETDGGEDDVGEDDGEEAEGDEYELVAVTVASASWYVYE